MQKSKIIFLLLLFYTFQFVQVQAQSDLELIEEKYHQLDSLDYLNNLREAVVRSSIHAYGEPDFEEIDREYDAIMNGIKGQNIRFVLNIDIDTTKLHTNNYLLAEDFGYDFNIYGHDRKFNPTYYIFFREGRLDIFGDVYPTFSRRFARKIKIALRRILKKGPKYMLHCQHLPNTVLYVNDDRIFVYRVLQDEEYELNDYVDKFKNTEGFYH